MKKQFGNFLKWLAPYLKIAADKALEMGIRYGEAKLNKNLENK